MDLANIGLPQIIISLFLLTALDWLSGVGASIIAHTFTWDRVAEFLNTHVLQRVVPLSVTAAIALGVPVIGLVAIPALWVIFVPGATAYLGETISSIAHNIGTAKTLPLTSVNGSVAAVPGPATDANLDK